MNISILQALVDGAAETQMAAFLVLLRAKVNSTADHRECSLGKH